MGVGSRVRDEWGAADLALKWLDRDPSARLLIDSSLKVRWANAAAKTWLSASSSISLVEGRLCAGRASPHLRTLVDRVSKEPETICIPTGDAEEQTILCARLVGADDGAPIFGLTMRRSDDVEGGPPKGALEAFGLTATEGKVLRLLLSGATAHEAAAQMHVSIETVRTHIRHLYAKTGVNSREGLFTRFRPFMVAA